MSQIVNTIDKVIVLLLHILLRIHLVMVARQVTMLLDSMTAIEIRDILG